MLTTDDKLKFNGGGNLMCNEITVKLLGMTVDDLLSFDSHSNMQRISHKLHALVRVFCFHHYLHI